MVEEKGRYLIKFNDIPSERLNMPELEAAEWGGNFEETKLGFSGEDAQKEARRCLSCRRCLGCGLCLAVCEPKAINFQLNEEIIDLQVDEIIIAPEVGWQLRLEKGHYGYQRHINVVSAFEFEGILNRDGPYAGLLMRPFDGEIPRRIAFIIDGSANNNECKRGNDFLICYALRQATSALKRVEDLAISIFIQDIEDVEKELVTQVNKSVRFRKVEILEVKEVEGTKNIIIVFVEDDSEKEEEYEMVIISKLPGISPGVKDLYKKLGLEVENDSSLNPLDPSMLILRATNG